MEVAQFASTVTDLKEYFRKTYQSPQVQSMRMPYEDDDDHSRNKPELSHKTSLPMLVRVSKQMYSSITDSTHVLSTNRYVHKYIGRNIQKLIVESYRRLMEENKKSAFTPNRYKIKISPSKKKTYIKFHKIDSSPQFHSCDNVSSKYSKSKITLLIKLEWGLIEIKGWKPEVRQSKCISRLHHCVPRK